MHDLHLETERDGETGTIRITGEVQTEIAPDVHAAGHGLLEDGARNLVVDLGGVVFMDSASLAVLIRLDAEVREGGGRFVLVAPSVAVRRVLDYSGLAERFAVAEDLADARSKLA